MTRGMLRSDVRPNPYLWQKIGMSCD